MNLTLSKKRELNLLNRITKHFWVFGGLGMLILMSSSAWAQASCENTQRYPYAAVVPNADGSFTAFDYCNYWGDFSEADGIISGYEYEFNSSQDDNNIGYITVREGSVDGTVIGEGFGPLSVTSTNGENLFVHWNADESCGVGSICLLTTVTCVSCATTPDCDGVLGGSALPGTPCDDGDATTYGDALTADCECVGTVYDCVEIMGNFGEACDDGDATTVNSIVTEDCECVGETAAAGSVCASAILIECNDAPATYSSDNSNGTNTTECSMGDKGLWFSFVGTGADITVNTTASFDHKLNINSGSCDDLISIICMDGSTGAENYTIESSVEGEMYYAYIAHYASESTTTGDIVVSITCHEFDCPEIEANIGDACDDGDEMTENDVITEDCNCLGTPIVPAEVCGLENFDNAELTETYADGSFVGNDDITWTYVAARDENGDENNSGIEGNAILLRRVADNSSITSSTISGGISDFSVKVYKGFTGGGDRQIELFINGDSYGLSDPFDDLDLHVFEVTGIDIAGDFVIEIKNVTSKQVIIDDITWTCGPDGDSYCEGEGVDFGTDGGIKSFTTSGGITDIDNQGIVNTIGYQNFTDMIVSQVAGESFTFTVDIEAVGMFNDAGIAVYIDYNNNSEFESNPSELVYTTITFETNLTATITIPENTDPGNYRLRTVSAWNALTPDPCNAESSIHDYTLKVVAIYDCQELEANIGDVCETADGEEGTLNASCDCIADNINSTDNTAGFNFTMYPNPVDRTGSLTLSSNQSIDRYEVLDITGKMIDAKTVSNQNEIEIVLSNYSTGLYILKAYNGSDFSTQKLIVR